MSTTFETLVRDYAAGRTSWSVLRTKGYTNYIDVLAKLNELDLRPPTAPDGLQLGAQGRLRGILRDASTISRSATR